MIHIIYVASAFNDPSEQDLLDLLNQARERNSELNITGMLLYDYGTYMQVLEGPKLEVHQVLSSIQRDKRIKRMVTLVEEDISDRAFPNWSMGFKNLAGSNPSEIPGYAEIFDGKLNTEIASKNDLIAINLLTSFAEEAEILRPD